MHVIGIQGMPRRVADYSDQFATMNLIISIASFFLGLSTLIFAYNMISSWRNGPRAPANPYRALTLEWQVSSPRRSSTSNAVPTVVGGPYEYGVPGAVHGIFKSPATAAAKPEPAQVAAGSSGGGDPGDDDGGREGEAPLMPHIVVLANQTIGGSKPAEAHQPSARRSRTRRSR